MKKILWILILFIFGCSGILAKNININNKVVLNIPENFKLNENISSNRY